MESAVPLLVLACGVSVALSLGSILWVTLFSGPAKLLSTQARVDRVEADWVAYKASLEGVLEAVEGVLESVERKRRQTTAAASRLETKPPDNSGQPQTRDDLLRPFRQTVYGQS